MPALNVLAGHAAQLDPLTCWPSSHDADVDTSAAITSVEVTPLTPWVVREFLKLVAAAASDSTFSMLPLMVPFLESGTDHTSKLTLTPVPSSEISSSSIEASSTLVITTCAVEML